MPNYHWTQEHRPGYRTITRVARISQPGVDGFMAAYREASLVLQEAILNGLVNNSFKELPLSFECRVSTEDTDKETFLRLDVLVPTNPPQHSSGI